MTRAKRNVGFKVLGTLLSFDGRYGQELANRIQRAWRAFFAHKNLLCYQGGSLKVRFKLLDSLVSRSLFWCSGTWVLTRKECEQLRGVQQAMERKLLGLKKTEGETAGEYVHRSNTALAELHKTFNRFSWSVEYHKSVYSLGGHFSRIHKYDPGRLTNAILRYKDWSWISHIASQNGGRQLHGRRLRTWRWERAFYKRFPWEPGAWHTVAADKVSWSSRLEELAVWRDKHR